MDTTPDRPRPSPRQDIRGADTGIRTGSTAQHVETLIRLAIERNFREQNVIFLAPSLEAQGEPVPLMMDKALADYVLVPLRIEDLTLDYNRSMLFEIHVSLTDILTCPRDFGDRVRRMARGMRMIWDGQMPVRGVV